MWSSSLLTSVLSSVWYPSLPPQNTEGGRGGKGGGREGGREGRGEGEVRDFDQIFLGGNRNSRIVPFCSICDALSSEIILR